MDEYFLSKKRLVEEQLVARGLEDQRLLDAFMKINRHNFVPERYKKFAYDDRPIPIGYGQTISQPYMVGAMTHLLMLNENDTLFEIGTGSGYQAAIDSVLCKKVITFEYVKELYEFALENILKEKITNVQIIHGDGMNLVKKYSPVEKIIVTAASPNLEEYFFGILKEGGIAVLPEGDILSQVLVKYTKNNDAIRKERFFGCMFVPLRGDYGF